MRKIIIVSLLALCLITPNISLAQTATPEEMHTQLVALIAQLTETVNALIAQLQEKIVAIQTQQAADSQTITAIQQQVTPTPVLGGEVVKPEKVIFAEPVCRDGETFLGITTSGKDWNYGYVRVTTPTSVPSQGNPDGGYGIEFNNNASPKEVEVNVGTNIVKVILSNQRIYPYNMLSLPVTATKTLEVSTCQ